MEIETATNLLDIILVSSKRLGENLKLGLGPAFYQQTLPTVLRKVKKMDQIARLGSSLINAAEQAYLQRRFDVVSVLANVLGSPSLSTECNAAGKYYEHFALHYSPFSDFTREEGLLYKVLETGSPKYKARALLSLGALRFKVGQACQEFFWEANRAAALNECCDPWTMAHSQKMVAVSKSLAGDHAGAVRDLEGQFPIVRSLSRVYPQLFYDWLNSLAVELAEVNRLEEASKVSSIAAGSKLAAAYPEWRATRDEIAATIKERSPRWIAVGRAIPEPGNLLSLVYSSNAKREENSTAALHTVPAHPARILNYMDWKGKMIKLSDSGPQFDIGSNQAATRREKLLRIIELASRKGITDEKLSKMVVAVETIAGEPKNQEQQ